MIDAAESKVLYRNTSGEMPCIVGALDYTLRDQEDREYLDMSGGACFASLGYSNYAVRSAILDQLLEVPYAFSGYWATRASEQAGELLAAEFEKATPGWFGKVIFQQGGGETVDLTCKLAAQYHAEAGDYRRRWVVSRDHSYHGVSLLPFAMSGYYPRYHKIYDYQAGQRARHISHSYDGSREPPTIQFDEAALVVEPVTGPTLGCWVESKEYMQGLRKACDDANALLIYDEILCGSGRCGYISTAEYYGVWPDIVLLGKGLAAGYQPVSAIVVSKKVIDRIAHGSGHAMFGTCFSAHSTGCAAVAAALRFMGKWDLFHTVQANGPILYGLLKEACHGGKVVKSIRGLGHLWGLEFADPTTGKHFAPDKAFHLQARNAVMAERVVTYTKGQTVNGHGDFMTIAPAYDMPMRLIREGVQRIARGIHLGV